MNKTEESLVRLKRESTKIRNESGDIAAHPTEIKRIKRKYWVIYSNKLHNIDETDS